VTTTSLKALGLASALLVAATVAVFAQATAPAPGGHGAHCSAACRADIQSLCGGVTGGRGARMQCLVENRTKASPECQSAMAAIQERFAQRGVRSGEKRARFAACKADVANLCPEATKGGERAQCLKQNEAKLSAECGTVMKQAKEARIQGVKQAREACRADAQALCGSAEKGGGGMMRCLRDNEAKVSPGCNQALAGLPGRKRGQMQPTTTPGVVPVTPPAAPSTAPAAPKPQ
jgi:Cysteine rich repeat